MYPVSSAAARWHSVGGREENVLVRFYAVGREISACNEAQFGVGSLAELGPALHARFGDRMARLVEASTLLIDGARHHIGDDLALSETDVVDLLPPFAGG